MSWAAGCINTAGAVTAKDDYDNLSFDTGLLGVHGVDASISELFRHAPRFMPGDSSVVLTVNGSSRGRIKARFDAEGALCANRDFQRQAGLVSPPGYAQSIACFDLLRAWPEAQVLSDPGEGKLSLVVPPEALSTSSAETGNWQHGGMAGMLNYDSQYMTSSGGAGAISFAQVGTEAGMNAGDWIMRSRQTFSRSNGLDQISHQNAYAQRSFAGIKKVLQVGQVSLSNSLFGTGQVLGFQMFPELALTSAEGGAGLVEGVAQTQSVVEVRQSGVLVYSTVVLPGPFRLQGFSLLNTRSDLLVTLTGSDRQVQQFTVPASLLQMRSPLVAPGFSFGLGRLDQQDGASPLVGTVATGWQLTPYASLNAGVLGATSYRAASMSLDSQLLSPTHLGLQTSLAQDVEHGNSGTLLSATLNHSLSEQVGINFNASQYGAGYRELSDALQRGPESDVGSRGRFQWGSGVSWSAGDLGRFSLSWARATSGQSRSDYLRSSWSRPLGDGYLGVSLERNSGSFGGQSDQRLHVTLSMPLGAGRDLHSYMSRVNRSTRAGARYHDRTHQDWGWSLSSDRDLNARRTSVGGNLDVVTPVSQLGINLGRDSDNYSNWSVRASGAAVLHEDGLTLSPYRVANTFGIARVGEEPGVRLDTPSGPVWTDARGYAVLPTLNGYRRSSIQVDTRSLAKNVDIGNAWQETEMAQGAIGRLDFEVMRTRRVLVAASMDNGQPVPHGASVFDEAGQLVTVVGQNGSVFVPDASPGMALEVQSSGKTLCTMAMDLPERGEASGFYENAAAVCR
ncbi:MULTISPECIES: fimbria/pilus outer membrane usher protein [unclassified Pseudomonas]|uniref:fimbria/pilus outer membrane usher protein n=1 Tax=unclassified Pseudomonas TaxID=196821 RepID=UPI002115C9FC|nr:MULTISPECIES: fimbria/pilus outer membrane usher protein [unclassified Pseudomonas]